MTTSLGKFVWFDHVSTNAKQAQAFYGDVFGWRVQDVPMGPVPYQMIAVGDTTVGGYAPPPADPKTPAHWIASLQVANADETAGKVTRAGGAVRLPPTRMGEFGTMAQVTDPLGGALNLWQPAKADDDDAAKPADGHFVWNELWATDVDRSLAFYKAIAGYTVEPMDMGPMGTYHLLKTGDENRGGVMKAALPGVPQMWLPYVQVAKVDTTVERAKKAGAEIVVPPSDIPGVGRFAVFKDPTGAVLGILQPAPSA